MYDDIQDFEMADFMEAEWRSFIETLQYAAPFYITYHCFPEIYNALKVLAERFNQAE